MSRPIFYGFIFALVLIGIITAWMRHDITGIPLTPGQQTSAWLVEAKVYFRAQGDEPVLASLNLPGRTPGYKLYFEQTASPGYGFSIIDSDNARRGEWSRREAEGQQTLYYKIQIVPDPNPAAELERPPEIITEVFWRESDRIAAENLLDEAYQRSSTPQSLTREVIKLVAESNRNQNSELLLANHSRPHLLEKLLSHAGLKARVAMALALQDARRNQSLVPMIEIYADDEWVVFDPLTGVQGLPTNMMFWHRDGGSLIDLMGASGAQVNFSMLEQKVPALELARAQSGNSAFDLLSIHHLPIEEQGVFKLLLLLPVGALITVLLRIIVGVRTSGTFMPVLIALAFLQTSLIPGLVNFISIVAIGLLLRSYLSSLNLLLVSRIATIIVIVVFIVGLMSLIGYQLGFNTGMTVAFFPIIILAWTIERMSILWEEDGPKEVLVQGGGSLLVAVLAYLAMQLEYVGYLSFNFPELNLVLVALIMLMGRYTGYRLLELRRFHAMGTK
ncbi:MAG: inactive transglutaminase family protein [Thiomicrospira sp.]|uniref:inactive transglutaminase family protein n=1 Tax=Thiomicrospira sp. TaxID=935 RepID=UPI0019E98623|nr:inactive transglutaminase family protein [Thiomicrospira sp.]MBE0494199.1 inactive transglutaminase family protein [Thiomicrospira sp.]